MLQSIHLLIAYYFVLSNVVYLLIIVTFCCARNLELETLFDHRKWKWYVVFGIYDSVGWRTTRRLAPMKWRQWRACWGDISFMVSTTLNGLKKCSQVAKMFHTHYLYTSTCSVITLELGIVWIVETYLKFMKGKRKMIFRRQNNVGGKKRVMFLRKFPTVIIKSVRFDSMRCDSKEFRNARKSMPSNRIHME